MILPSSSVFVVVVVSAFQVTSVVDFPFLAVTCETEVFHGNVLLLVSVVVDRGSKPGHGAAVDCPG